MVKVLENIIKANRKNLVGNEIEAQHGFQEGTSYQTNLKFMKQISQFEDKREPVNIVHLYYRKYYTSMFWKYF